MSSMRPSRTSSVRSPRGFAAFVRRVANVARAENVSLMAGGLAYYAFLSLFPFGTLLVLAVAIVGVESFADRLITLTGSTVSPQVNAFVQQNVFTDDVSGAVGASLVGLVTLLWGLFKLFGGLSTAFSEIYDTPGDTSLVDSLVDGVVLLVTIPLALVGVSLATVVLSFVTIRSVRFATPLLLVGGLTVVFLPLYYVFPDTDVSIREILPGVVVAAVGWVVLQQLFQVYVFLAETSAGGIVGAVLLFLTWLYFAAVVILVGCVVNAVHGGYNGRHTDEQ